MPNWRLKVSPPAGLTRRALAQKKQDMAEALVASTRDRIAEGGDEEYTFAPLAMPREDGSTDRPLRGSGKLADSLYSFVRSGGFGVASDMPGARALLLGTTGKGGLLPPIVPKQAAALRFWVGGHPVFVTRVELPPRSYMRISRKDVSTLLNILAGNR